MAWTDERVSSDVRRERGAEGGRAKAEGRSGLVARRTREQGLAFAARWREANRARFDAMDEAGMFSDSLPREWPIEGRRSC